MEHNEVTREEMKSFGHPDDWGVDCLYLYEAQALVDAKLAADPTKQALVEALDSVIAAVDCDHIKAVEARRVTLSGDAVRDLFCALDKARAALALARK